MNKTTRNQDSTKARTRTAREAPCDSGTALAALCPGDSSQGAPPSNTAPPNCMYGSSLIRCGVDSLYISHRGSLNEDRDLELRQLKLAAQSFDSEEKASARLRLMDHYFEVKDKGRGRFPFVLADNWFHIQVSSSISNSLPLTQTQISSEVLTRSGIDSSTSKLRGVVQQLGSFEDDIRQVANALEPVAFFGDRLLEAELAERMGSAGDGKTTQKNLGRSFDEDQTESLDLLFELPEELRKALDHSLGADIEDHYQTVHFSVGPFEQARYQFERNIVDADIADILKAATEH